MEILKPQKLKIGDTVGVIAPSGVVEAKGVDSGVKILKKWGFKVKLGKHIFKKVEDYSAGTPQERREDFESMVNDPEIKAITCAEGGYAATSVLLTLSPKVIEAFKTQPTLLFGYSDFSIFLNANFSLGITGIHASNLGGLASHNKETQESLRKALFGEMELNYGPKFFTKILIPGKAEGYFLPTNLETLTHLFGSKFDPLENFDGPIILGLEEVWEDKSDVRRMFEEIILHRCFNKVKGIVLGRFVGDSEIEYPKWGKKTSWHDLFISLLKDKNIPVAEFPNFGHLEEQRKAFKLLRIGRKKNIYSENLFLALPVGAKTILNALSDNPSLIFQDQAVGVYLVQ
ncbi:MAG: S66 peptidase family protein [Patescibacteria group bacterium]